jgi:hypothetical protein
MGFQTAVQFGFLCRRQRNNSLFGRYAVPDLLDKNDALGDTQLREVWQLRCGTHLTASESLRDDANNPTIGDSKVLVKLVPVFLSLLGTAIKYT